MNRLLLLAMLMLGSLCTQAEAAQDSGHSFPCTPSFAEKVAVRSGFANRAAKVNTNFSYPQFWTALAPLCADYDADGNTEMVIELGAMGGNSPWAFFDVPNGNPDAAVSRFPTITTTGPYPNHFLRVLHRGGHIDIKDTRRIYRHRAPHCCPTGGRFARIIGYRPGAGYEVIRSSQSASEVGAPRTSRTRQTRRSQETLRQRCVRAGMLTPRRVRSDMVHPGRLGPRNPQLVYTSATFPGGPSGCTDYVRNVKVRVQQKAVGRPGIWKALGPFRHMAARPLRGTPFSTIHISGFKKRGLYRCAPGAGVSEVRVLFETKVVFTPSREALAERLTGIAPVTVHPHPC